MRRRPGILAVLRCVRALAALVLIALLPATGRAQEVSASPLTAFLDCRADGCDRDFFVTELPYVMWTQDRLDAEVHLLVTGLQTGAGGSEYTIALLGQRRFAGRGDTVVTTVPPNSTDDARRRELARVMRLALVPYILRTPAASRLSLAYEAPAASAPGPRLRDPWNNWVYRAAASGSGGAESRSSEYGIEAQLTASRITDLWKIVVEGEFEYESNSFELDSSSVEFVLRNWELESRAVRSISDHWSVGAGGGISMSEFENQDFSAAVEAALEYNFFPYREATSRQVIAAVSAGARHFDYAETTIYGRDTETRLMARMLVAAETRQRWGSLFASLDHFRYLHDADVYSIELDANVDIRLTRGLSVSFGANAEKVNDQLYLPRGDASDDEVLTEQRALATNYRVRGYAGVTFTFGSIFNTIVNPRFELF